MLRTTNPNLDEESTKLGAWIEGFETVDNSEITPHERVHLFHLGRDAADRGGPASMCPYLNDDNPERMEIWLLGYAPYVDAGLIHVVGL